MALNLGDLLAEAGNVPISGTKRELVDLKLSELHSDPKNFYSLEGIEDLAANIELVGLQQPILVRPDGDGYMVISGHRRKAALELLAKEGKEQFSTVPCFIQREQRSEAWQELCLIYGNASTRKLSNYDLSQQAERVQELFYQLKEEGVEFPGRMRDHVAEACKVTKSKLSRLKVINDRLKAPAAVELWKSGKMREATAYALAQQKTEMQMCICEFYSACNDKLEYMGEGNVKSILQKWKNISDIDCKMGGKCNYHDSKMRKCCKNNYYGVCEHYCCKNCPELARCSISCPHCIEEKADVKSEAKAARRAEKDEAREKERIKIEKTNLLWRRFGYAMERSFEKDYQSIASECGFSPAETISTADALLTGQKKNTSSSTHLPFGYYIDIHAVEVLSRICERMDVSADYLLGLTNEYRTLSQSDFLSCEVDNGD